MFGLTRREQAAKMIRDEAKRVTSGRRTIDATKFINEPGLAIKLSLEMDVHKIDSLSSVLSNEYGSDDFFDLKFLYENARKGIDEGSSDVLYAYKVLGRLAELHDMDKDGPDDIESIMKLSAKDLSEGYENVSEEDVYEDIKRKIKMYRNKDMFSDKTSR